MAKKLKLYSVHGQFGNGERYTERMWGTSGTHALSLVQKQLLDTKGIKLMSHIQVTKLTDIQTPQNKKK